VQAQAAQMRQFEEVLINELKMQEEERVILKHTAETVKQVRRIMIIAVFVGCMFVCCLPDFGYTISKCVMSLTHDFVHHEHNMLFKCSIFVNPLGFVLYNSFFFIFLPTESGLRE